MASVAQTVRIIRVFVSSPGDVSDERAVLDEIVGSTNRTDGSAGGFRLELFKWEVNVTPRIGPKPQRVVDDQTPQYDIYLGIMSTRFGTPTGRHGSGTEKECRDALKRWKDAKTPWITFYFNDTPKLSRKPADAKQYVKVCEFREELETKGIVCGYTGVRGSRDGFFEQVSEHLRTIVRQLTSERRVEAADTRGQQRKDSDDGPMRLPANIEFHLNRLANETAQLTMIGMGRSLQVELPIVEAYVPLRATLARSMEERGTERFKENQAEYEENVDLCDIFRKASQLQLRGVVLLGEPGSGKTTGARQLASSKTTYTFCATCTAPSRSRNWSKR